MIASWSYNYLISGLAKRIPKLWCRSYTSPKKEGQRAAWFMEMSNGVEPPLMETEVLQVDSSQISGADLDFSQDLSMQDWNLEIIPSSQTATNLQRAARELREKNVPVAFPTETVYGLGADVTRSSAVLGIFKAKQRPSDNPLIVHVSSLYQLRCLLDPEFRVSGVHKPHDIQSDDSSRSVANGIPKQDPIPEIYRPLIQKFWPGPLSLIMPVPPKGSILAPEVTAGLNTFGARMPQNAIALALIKMSGVPLAAPSANASTKPSTTTANHVRRDLQGRISTIIDGGPCEVGVESTVVDGLNNPPLVLRPGGISLDQLRTCPGWEDVRIGYKDASEHGSNPKAPGMKYKHYSPKARVVLYEFTEPQPDLETLVASGKAIGVIRTRNWRNLTSSDGGTFTDQSNLIGEKTVRLEDPSKDLRTNESNANNAAHPAPKAQKFDLSSTNGSCMIWDISLGTNPHRIARGLFSALREFDDENVDVIFVEGIDEKIGDVAAAIMNRLRKAAETRIGVV